MRVSTSLDSKLNWGRSLSEKDKPSGRGTIKSVVVRATANRKPARTRLGLLDLSEPVLSIRTEEIRKYADGGPEKKRVKFKFSSLESKKDNAFKAPPPANEGVKYESINESNLIDKINNINKVIAKQSSRPLDDKARLFKILEEFESSLSAVESGAEPLQTSELPKAAPELYKPRGPEKASEHLKRVWGAWMEGPVAKRLSMQKLKELDPKLATALDNEFRGNADALGALLPTKKMIADELLANYGLTPKNPVERSGMVQALLALEARKND